MSDDPRLFDPGPSKPVHGPEAPETAGRNLSEGQFDQLEMFKSPHDVKASYRAWPADAHGAAQELVMRAANILNDPQFDTAEKMRRVGPAADLLYGLKRGTVTDEDVMWRQKKGEALQSGLRESVASGGVEKPVRIGKNTIYDGHHRIQAAIDTDRTYIPVEHHTGFASAHPHKAQAIGEIHGTQNPKDMTAWVAGERST